MDLGTKQFLMLLGSLCLVAGIDSISTKNRVTTALNVFSFSVFLFLCIIY